LALLACRCRLVTSSFSVLADHSWLCTSDSSLELLCALLETTNRFDS
jgi:hypothetical protein